MFDKVVLRNFQLHKHKEVELGRITTFVGPSDRGKSSFLRAIRLVCRNQPAGEAFIRHGKSRCVATLTAEGREVKRTKGSENSYTLDGGEPLKVITQGSNGIPDAVQNLLRTDDICFQLQHDPPFWFADTPGQVSKALNRIVNLGVIDRTLSRASAAVKKAQTVEEVTAARVKEAEEAVGKLDWVRGFDEKLTALISARDRAAEVDNEVGRLEGLIDKYAEAVEEQNRLRLVSERGGGVVSAGLQATLAETKYDRLKALLRLHKAHRAEQDSRVGDFGPVEEARVEGDRAAEACGRLERLMDQYEVAEENLCRLRSEQKEVEKGLGNRCPQCGSSLMSSPFSPPTSTSRKPRR